MGRSIVCERRRAALLTKRPSEGIYHHLFPEVSLPIPLNTQSPDVPVTQLPSMTLEHPVAHFSVVVRLGLNCEHRMTARAREMIVRKSQAPRFWMASFKAEPDGGLAEVLLSDEYSTVDELGFADGYLGAMFIAVEISWTTTAAGRASRGPHSKDSFRTTSIISGEMKKARRFDKVILNFEAMFANERKGIGPSEDEAGKKRHVRRA